MIGRFAAAGALVLGSSLLFACYGMGDGTWAPDGGTTSTTGVGKVATGDAGPSGLPCDIQTILKAHCTSCHSDPPVAGPMGLETYADLTAPAVTNPNETVAQLSLQRIQSTLSPMPRAPAAPLSATEISTFAAWVDAGTPKGSCAASDAGDPYNTPVVCTSGTQSGGGEGSSTMRPGEACIACHSQGEGPRFTIAGTVYPTAQEPNGCNGASGASVIINDAKGVTTTLTTNSAGNFSSRATFATPYTVKVVANGKERVMSLPPPSGDCNSCHARPPTNGAPGRIMLP